MKRGCLITNALACFLWMFFVFFILASPVFAEPGGMRPVVRVGVLNHSTYADQDDQGIWHGLDVECMISIAQRAGFNVEFIDGFTVIFDASAFGYLYTGKLLQQVSDGTVTSRFERIDTVSQRVFTHCNRL